MESDIGKDGGKDSGKKGIDIACRFGAMGKRIVIDKALDCILIDGVHGQGIQGRESSTKHTAITGNGGGRQDIRASVNIRFGGAKKSDGRGRILFPFKIETGGKIFSLFFCWRGEGFVLAFSFRR